MVTPWAERATAARPFWTGDGFAVAWAGEARASEEEQPLVWTSLADPASDLDAVTPIVDFGGNPSASRVSVIDGRALVVLRRAVPETDPGWHALLFETDTGAVVADVVRSLRGSEAPDVHDRRLPHLPPRDRGRGSRA